jgi:predicted nucleic acid-binding protein
MSVRLANYLRQITDTYLLALAQKHGGRLVTFDSGIALVRQ